MTNEKTPLTEIQAKKYFNDFRKKFFRNAACYLQTRSACTEKAIRSHSVSKSALRLIASDGHVGNISVRVDTFSDNPEPGYERTGINQASTFLGFCSRHDAEIFRPLDSFDGPVTPEVAALSFYRCLVQEFGKKAQALSLYESFETKGSFEQVRKLMAAGSAMGLTDLIHELDQFEASGKRVCADLCHIEIQFNEILPFAFSSPKNLNLIFGTVPLDDLPQALVSFSMFPHRSGTRFLLVYPRSEGKNVSRFLRELELRKSSVSQDLLSFGLTQFENLYMDADWYEGLSAGQQKALPRLFYGTKEGDETIVRLPETVVEGTVRATRANCQSGSIWKRRFK